MAEVLDGWDTRLNRPVAVKTLYPGLNSQADVRERFTTEARAAAALNHPNIVAVYDLGDDGGAPFIVMERLPGDTLGDQIAMGPLPQARVANVLRSVLAALAEAHRAGVLHRDIKPGNILLAPPDDVKVADFGIAKTPGSVHTTAGQIVGTLAYLSPDRIHGRPASVTDDLYAVGVVGYEALTGCKPFPHEDIVPLAHAIIEGAHPPLAQLRPDVDPWLAEVIERALSPDPLRRFPTAAAMWAALAAPAPAPSVRTAVPALAASGPVPPVLRPRRATKVAGAATLFAAMVLGAALFAVNPTSASRPPTPEAVTIPNTPAPAPRSIAAEPPPVVEPVPAEPAPVVEQAAQKEPPRTAVGTGDAPEAGKGNGNGKPKGNNGNGNRKPKEGNGNGRPR
ncbi:MAG: protein kinase [Mycolicibacterium sp.]